MTAGIISNKMAGPVAKHGSTESMQYQWHWSVPDDHAASLD